MLQRRVVRMQLHVARASLVQSMTSLKGRASVTGALAIAFTTACIEPGADDNNAEIAEAGLGTHQPGAGSAGLDDPLYETLGNGGYDAIHYVLDLRYETAASTQPIDGSVTIVAFATQSLSSFNLDFSGDSIGAVTVNGRPATARRDGEELVITPARALYCGLPFVVRVEHFTSTPGVPSASDLLAVPFFATPDGSAWAGQPAGAHRIFPSNDHPRDKASFTFRLDVPASTTAVANGTLLAKRTGHDRSVWWYEQAQPMATELAQVAVGDLSVISRGTHDGIEVRDVVPTRLAEELGPKLAVEVDHIKWMAERVGDYPFNTYGSLLLDTSLGFALETQTLSLFEVAFFRGTEPEYAPIMVHELAHQWFGDSVAPASWTDVWQNEGHATWYELTYQMAPDSPELEELMRQVYTYGDLYRAYFGPVGTPRSGDVNDVFSPNAYYGGALVLYALRQQVGDEKFQAIERAWVREYRGRSASSADFIALASRIPGQDLTAFLNEWLYSDVTPPMPGHADWTVEPVTSVARMFRPMELALPASEIEEHRMRMRR